MNRIYSSIIFIALALVVVVPIIASGMSPQLAWRNPVYIVGGFGGVVAISLLLLQPMLAGGLLPGLSVGWRLRAHRWIGSALAGALLIHLVGLWITSPPDVIDALLLVSATPFSIWGVIAMWSVFSTAILVVFRRRLGLSARKWRLSHQCLASVTVIGSVVHALMIEGTMETVSKTVLCACIIVATGVTIVRKSRNWNSGN